MANIEQSSVFSACMLPLQTILNKNINLINTLAEKVYIKIHFEPMLHWRIAYILAGKYLPILVIINNNGQQHNKQSTGRLYIFQFYEWLIQLNVS